MMSSEESRPYTFRELLLWGKGGYYRVDVDEKSTPSIPAGDRAWQIFLDFAPEEVIWDVYGRLKEACEAEERCQTGPGAAVSGARHSPDEIARGAADGGNANRRPFSGNSAGEFYTGRTLGSGSF